MKIKFTSLLLFAMMLMILNTDAKQKKKQPVDGSPFKTQKTMMVFIELREGMVPAQGIEKMAKDFGLMMSTGGLHVSVVGVDKNNMIAIA
jgi:hypothetical protein